VLSTENNNKKKPAKTMIDFFSLKKDTSTYFLPFYIVEEASYQSLISVHCNIHSVKI